MFIYLYALHYWFGWSAEVIESVTFMISWIIKSLDK